MAQKLVRDFAQDAIKASGRPGEATIIRLPDHDRGLQPGRSSVFTIVPIGLEIGVLGLETYQVDKVFTFPHMPWTNWKWVKWLPYGWTRETRVITIRS